MRQLYSKYKWYILAFLLLTPVILNIPLENHAFAPILEWIKIVIQGFTILLALGPIAYVFYQIVEKRLIPGSLDDYLANLWAPLKKYDKEVLGSIKWTAAVTGIVGGTLLASKTELTPYGFLFLASSSGLWFVAAAITKDQPLLILNAFLFIMVDTHGIYRWLLVK